jgi:hypothetical protein
VWLQELHDCSTWVVVSLQRTGHAATLALMQAGCSRVTACSSILGCAGNDIMLKNNNRLISCTWVSEAEAALCSLLLRQHCPGSPAKEAREAYQGACALRRCLLCDVVLHLLATALCRGMQRAVALVLYM